MEKEEQIKNRTIKAGFTFLIIAFHQQTTLVQAGDSNMFGYESGIPERLSH